MVRAMIFRKSETTPETWNFRSENQRDLDNPKFAVLMPPSSTLSEKCVRQFIGLFFVLTNSHTHSIL